MQMGTPEGVPNSPIRPDTAAPDPGRQGPQQLLVSIRSALNPLDEGSTSQTTGQLHLKLGVAQRQAFP